MSCTARKASVDSDYKPRQEHGNGNAEEASHSHGQVAVVRKIRCPLCVLHLVLGPAEFFDFYVEQEFHSEARYLVFGKTMYSYVFVILLSKVWF